MNRLILLAPFVLAFAFCQSVLGQSPAPPGAGDKNLSDRSIKDRSIELERIKREMDKENSASKDKTVPMNFAQIKEDFEQIQVVFDKGIVTTYKMSNPINYAKISESAAELKDRATRLRSNLFPDRPKKSKDKKEEVAYVPVSGAPSEAVKNLIVNLNDSLATFVASPIFQNAKVVDPKESEKARKDLETIIAQSTQLEQEAGKVK
jgi:hypothetical protein